MGKEPRAERRNKDQERVRMLKEKAKITADYIKEGERGRMRIWEMYPIKSRERVWGEIYSSAKVRCKEGATTNTRYTKNRGSWEGEETEGESSTTAGEKQRRGWCNDGTPYTIRIAHKVIEAGEVMRQWWMVAKVEKLERWMKVDKKRASKVEIERCSKKYWRHTAEARVQPCMTSPDN